MTDKIEDFIMAFEAEAEIIKNSVNYQGEWRIIREKAWDRLKRRFLPRYGVDEVNDMLMEVDDGS